MDIDRDVVDGGTPERAAIPTVEGFAIPEAHGQLLAQQDFAEAEDVQSVFSADGIVDFLDVDSEDVSEDWIMGKSDKDLRMAFKKVYEFLEYGNVFELIPRNPNGVVHRIFLQGRYQPLRQRLVRVFGTVKVVEDISDNSRCRYEFSSEFKDRRLSHYIRHTHTAHFDEKLRIVDCYVNDRDGFIIIRFGKKFQTNYNAFIKALKESGARLEKRTSRHPGTGGGLAI